MDINRHFFETDGEYRERLIRQEERIRADERVAVERDKDIESPPYQEESGMSMVGMVILMAICGALFCRTLTLIFGILGLDWVVYISEIIGAIIAATLYLISRS